MLCRKRFSKMVKNKSKNINKEIKKNYLTNGNIGSSRLEFSLFHNFSINNFGMNQLR